VKPPAEPFVDRQDAYATLQLRGWHLIAALLLLRAMVQRVFRQ
jgi:hypothetical protein